MKPFASYDDARVMSGPRAKLPIGGYVMKILNAEEIAYGWGRVLLLSVDVSEGEHKGFFGEDYKAQIEPKKWRGTVRLNVPKDDGSEQDGWTADVFKTNMSAIEVSNAGYIWDWDEVKLKNKYVGVLVRNKEYEFDGRTGFYSECFKLIPVEDVRSMRFVLPKDKLLGNSSNRGIGSTSTETEDDGNLPWI